MFRAAVDQLQPGMVLARAVPSPAQPLRTLLPRHAEVTSDSARLLERLGVREVWVRCRELEFLEDVVDAEQELSRRELYGRVRSNFERMLRAGATEADWSSFQDSMLGLFDVLRETHHGHTLLERLYVFDDYLMSHSTNVCYLAMLTALRAESYLLAERRAETAPQERPAGEPSQAAGPGDDAADFRRAMRQLGLGCLLHDVGKMQIAPAILNKPGKLTPEEFEQIKRHTIYGFEMVAGKIDAEAADIVLHHHQRWDGKGYPAAADAEPGDAPAVLSGREIPVFSRIVTLADVYDAATSRRCYSAAKPSVQVLHEMRTWCRGAFDPVLERAFYEVVPPFPIGSIVTLSNGLEAVVVDFNPRLPINPKVLCLRTPSGEAFEDPHSEEIDLAAHPDIDIVRIGGTDVRPFLELQRTVVAD